MISGNLGQWLLLATTSSERHSEGAGIDSYDSSGSSGQSEVWVMVELLPD